MDGDPTKISAGFADTLAVVFLFTPRVMPILREFKGFFPMIRQIKPPYSHNPYNTAFQNGGRHG
jgi:hypothetical protein